MFKGIIAISYFVGAEVRRMAALLLVAGFMMVLPGVAGAATSWYADGKYHTVALMHDGTVWVAGEDNSQGQFGNGKFSEGGSEPVKVEGLSDIKAVAAGSFHSLALKQDGTVWTWGGNSFGQLGNGSTEDSNVVRQVPGLDGVTAVAAGGSHSVVLKKDGSVWSWGDNRLGQLGAGSISNSALPVKVGSIGDVKSISAGGYHTIALKQDGSVWTWGYNAYGELGNDAVSSKGSPVPVQVSELSNVRAISSGTHHCIALKNDRTVWAWGSNFYSQLGNGTTRGGSSTPVMVSGVSGVGSIIGRANHTMALLPDNTVLAWGDNGSGRWGNGVAMNGSAVPVQMSGLSGLTTVAAVADPRSLTGQERTFMAGLDFYDTTSETAVNGAESASDSRFLVASASLLENF